MGTFAALWPTAEQTERRGYSPTQCLNMQTILSYIGVHYECLYLLRKRHLRAVGPIETVVFLAGRRVADLVWVLLSADQADVARTQLIERVLETPVRNEATLTKRQFALTNGLAMSTGTAKSGLTVRIAMATGSLNIPNSQNKAKLS